MLEDLRLLILIIGVVAFAFLAFDSIRRRFKKNNNTAQFDQTIFENTHSQSNKDLNIDPLFLDHENGVQKDVIMGKKVKPSLSKAVQEVVIISVQSRHKGGFNGRTLESALKGHCYYFGEKNIFHRHVGDNPENPILYSIAQATEPGAFDLEKIKFQRVPGVVVFMILPIEHENPVQVFEQMLKSARQLAATLNGELCDGQHNQLTSQTIEHYKELIQDNHRRTLALRQKDG